MLAMRIVGWAMSSVLQDGTQKQIHQTPQTDTSSAGTGARGFVPGAAPATGALSPPSAINPATVLANPAGAEKSGTAQEQKNQAAADVVRRSANPSSSESAARAAIEGAVDRSAPRAREDHKSRKEDADAMFGSPEEEARAAALDAKQNAAAQAAFKAERDASNDHNLALVQAEKSQTAQSIETRRETAPPQQTATQSEDALREQAEISSAESHARSLALQAELRAQYLVREIQAAVREAKQSAIEAARNGEKVGGVDIPTSDQRFAASQVLATYNAAIVASRAA
ncbi:hypothetical protein [Litorivita sp. NS0012-18]|uniref:hypothetical protein n=1 Tax=Litorivita sp. NS0012-18 TaxID=3127655 RepID=UPI003107CB33